MKIGFSTGSIAFGDVRRGLEIATHRRTNAVELSALREDELDPLLELLDELNNNLTTFSYISFHAPSKRERTSEADFVSKLQQVADRGWAIIVHPDVIEDFPLWRPLRDAVCIENMDKRKKFGRTAAQLKLVFDQLPDATFCFDIGHARQVDPTMQEASTLLRDFRSRLRQIHMSYVNSQSQHERLNYESILAFQRVARWIDQSIPIILETPIDQDEVDDEISAAEQVFALVQPVAPRFPSAARSG
jgi:sugar phosphate isomerase/epimerase